jgi:hypothetical protein
MSSPPPQLPPTPAPTTQTSDLIPILGLAIGATGLLLALVTALAGAIITWRVAGRQREHDLKVRQQQFDHELRLERTRYRERLQEARLERLRSHLTTIVAAAWELALMPTEAWRSGRAEGDEMTRYTQISRRLREGSAALSLETEAHRLIDLINPLLEATEKAASGEVTHDFEQAMSLVARRLGDEARVQLRRIERQRLEQDSPFPPSTA